MIYEGLPKRAPAFAGVHRGGLTTWRPHVRRVQRVKAPMSAIASFSAGTAVAAKVRRR